MVAGGGIFAAGDPEGTGSVAPGSDGFCVCVRQCDAVRGVSGGGLCAAVCDSAAELPAYLRQVPQGGVVSADPADFALVHLAVPEHSPLGAVGYDHLRLPLAEACGAISYLHNIYIQLLQLSATCGIMSMEQVTMRRKDVVLMIFFSRRGKGIATLLVFVILLLTGCNQMVSGLSNDVYRSEEIPEMSISFDISPTHFFRFVDGQGNDFGSGFEIRNGYVICTSGLTVLSFEIIDNDTIRFVERRSVNWPDEVLTDGMLFIRQPDLF